MLLLCLAALACSVLPPDVADVPYLEFEARSLWCQPDVNPRFYNTGFHFRSIASESTTIVQKVVEAYGFRDN